MNRKPSRKALLVGINAYPPPFSSLRGCINDVHELNDVLTKRHDFHSENVRMLLNSSACRQSIIDNLNWLVAGAQPNDVLVFAYSGHGSQVDDDSGDEWECRDEILIPFDHCWDKPLRDDHLKEIFDRVPLGALLIFICDSCHSGTVNKAITDSEIPRVVFVPAEIQRRIAAKIAKRNEECKSYVMGEIQRASRDLPPAEVSAMLDDLFDKAISGFKQNRFQFVKTNENNILLAACQDVETSADAYIDGNWHGAFTHSIVKTLTGTSTKLTYAEMVSIAASDLIQYQQTPQLECPDNLRDLVVFAPISAQ